MKIAILGASGMLGREVVKAAASHDVIALDRARLDITCRTATRAALRLYYPDVVINCAGLTKHRIPEPDAVEYRHVNTYGPLMLAQECDHIGARLIHVSTDCVFSGGRPIEDGPYTEADLPDATDHYGRSKADGEVVGGLHLTVRCSFIGNGERGLIAWLRGADAGQKIRGEAVMGWRWQAWSGSTAPAIARALVEFAQRTDVTGLMHLTDGQMVNKATLLLLLRDALGLTIGVRDIDAPNPPINRWLASTRSDVPALPPLHEALRELAL